MLTRIRAHWAGALLDCLLPRYCLLCRQATGGGQVCTGCRRDLPRCVSCCTLCALPLPTPTRDPAAVRCGRCLLHPPPWDAAIAALEYRFPVDRVVCRFKFGRDLCSGELLGRELLHAVLAAAGEMPDAIVPVPLHRTRYFSRTFNQAELLASRLGRSLEIPTLTRLLLRGRRTRAQSGLDAVARRRNIRGAFRVKRRTARSSMPRHIALVDDVLTTGVTLAECTRTLKRSGVKTVCVWVAARAPRP